MNIDKIRKWIFLPLFTGCFIATYGIATILKGGGSLTLIIGIMIVALFTLIGAIPSSEE